MNQTIIELNQEDIHSVSNSNGDYTINLQKPLLINKGDQVLLKSCFVDNRVINSNSIEVKGDILPDGSRDTKQTITIGFGYYKSDILGTWEDANASAGSQTTIYNQNYIIDGDANLNLFTGRPFPSVEPINNPTTNLVDIVSFEIAMSNFPFTSFSSTSTKVLTFGNKHFNITFTNDYLADAVHEWQRASDGTLFITLDENELDKLRKRRVISFSNFPITLPKPASEKVAFIDPNSRSGIGARPLILNVSTSPHQSADQTYDIYGDEISFQIDSGFYDPSDIAELLTEKIVNIEFNGELNHKNYEVSRNPLLKTIQQIRIDENKEIEFFDINESNPRKFKYQTSATQNNNLLNYIIGSSQFGLSYNQGEDKMEILSIHNSLFNSRFNPANAPQNAGQPSVQSTSPEVRIVRNKCADNDLSRSKATKFVCNKNSGIYLTKLEPIELWYGEDSQFKFSGNIIPQYKTKTFTTVDSVGNSSTNKVISPIELVEGVNITSDEAGLDEIIQKKIDSSVVGGIFVAGGFQAFDIQKPLLQDESIISDVIGSNTIIAENKIGSSILDEGAYYKVSIDMGIKNELLGNNNNNTISSIISKYYSQNSYTSSYSEGSIPYLHSSDEPLYVSNIRVRILDPNNSVSERIGDRNSVFLEVLKSE